MNRKIVALILGGLLVTMLASAAEMRIWTDRKGRSFEGSFVKMDGEEVVILHKTSGNEVRVKQGLLSATDVKYLAEYGDVKMDIDPTAVIRKIPEKDVRIDKATFKKLEDPFVFPDTELTFDVLESEHFKIMTDGRINPASIAETAERLWHGMVFQHPSFREKWGEAKHAVFVVEDPASHKLIGEYYMDYLAANGQQDSAMKLAITWPKSGGSTISITPDIQEQDGIADRARVFKVSDNNSASYKKVFTPFVTHCIASDMVNRQMGGVSGFGSKGFFALTTGHAFFKEIQLAGESGTSLIGAEYDSDEIKSARGFENGTSWAKELKKVVRKEKMTPTIEQLYAMKQETMSPTDLVLLYSFSHFMQTTQGKMEGYAKMLERIDTSNQVPVPVELAKLLGYETAEELEAGWLEYINSSTFKD